MGVGLYDKNGNIKTLWRDNMANTKIDQLSYTYANGEISNKLLNVEDSSGSPEGFINGDTQATEYTYDGNGNLKVDLNKGITSISYNYLNLPKEIVFAPNKKIEYFYDAVGTKQKKKVTDGAVITTTDYAGKFVYQNNALQFISQPEGYLELDGQGGYDYTYQYKDHLGNIRLYFMDSDGNGQIAQSEIKEENNYYPFGLKHSGYNMLVFSANLALKYKYNGKELQDEQGLDWYDYGARKYDPALGRWHSVDPLAEAYSSYSSYNYTLNNPIRYIDPDGRWVKGAGLLRNIFKSDERIEAEDRVTEIGGDAEAHRNKVAGGWNVTYTSGEKVDLGNGDIELKTFNIENYSKKNRNVAAGGGGNADGNKHGWVTSFLNGAAAVGPFGAMGDIGAVFDSYGKSSLYLTIGGAYGGGASFGGGISRTSKYFNLEDFGGSSQGFMWTFFSVGFESFSYSPGPHPSPNDNKTKYTGKGINIGLGAIYGGYYSYTFLFTIPAEFWSRPGSRR